MEDLINYMKKRLFEKLSEIFDKCITQSSELYPKVMIYSYDNFGYDKDELIENRTRHLNMNINRFIEPKHFKEKFDAIFDELFYEDNKAGDEIEDESGLCEYSIEKTTPYKSNTLEIVNLPKFFETYPMFKDPYREETENLIITFPYLISEIIRQTIQEIMKN